MKDPIPIPAAPPVSPWFGLLAVAICTPLAVLMIPDDHRPAGALFAPAMLLTIGILVSPAITILRAPAAIVRVDNLLMLGLTYWLLLDLLQGSYGLEDVGREAVWSSFAAIGLFAGGIWLAGTHSAWRLPELFARSARIEWKENALFGAVIVCGGIALFRFAWACGFDPALMITSLGGNRWSAPWGRGALGGWDAFIDHFTYFGYLLPTLTVLLAHLAGGWAKPKVVVSLLLTVLVMIFVAHSGSRRIVGVTFGAAIICWVLLPRKSFGYATLVIPALGITALLVFMQVVVEHRSTGFGRLWEGERIETKLKHLHVDDNFLRLAQVIELVPEHYPHTYEEVFIWVAIRPIPRVLWPDKPLDPGFSLAEILGLKGVSLTFSAIGELYLSCGWLAILFGGWLYGRLGGICNQFLTAGGSPVRILMYAFGAMAIFAGLRSLIELMLMSYLLLAWIGVSIVFSEAIRES